MKGFSLGLVVFGGLTAVRAEVVRRRTGAARLGTQACHRSATPLHRVPLGSLLLQSQAEGVGPDP